MAEFKQENRLLGITTPLGDNKVVLASFTGREELSRQFNFHLELISHEPDLDPSSLVGENISFWVKHGKDEKRYFNGFVRRFSKGLWNGKFRRYRVEVVSWLWFLTQTTDCRIFQEKTVPEIIEQIFQDLGFTDYDISGITGEHEKWVYCVQYRESDFNFVSRLMEEEGIYYFFKHENGKHTLHMADSVDGYVDALKRPIGYPYDLGTRRVDEVLTNWEHQYEYRTGAWAQTDFDFERPTFDLMTTSNTSGNYSDEDKFEAYDYPGGYVKKPRGQGLTDMRMEEDEAPRDLISGTSTAAAFTPGGKFEVDKHYASAEIGSKFVITSIRHIANEPAAYTSGGASPEPDYNNRFTCIPADCLFRPGRITPAPVVQGTQTAIVVGPKGEEIYTDKYGRVKVQFHWDREGKYDENSSCWIRVSQNWAGKRWGAFFLPRISQEVIVDFLEGDPDQPLVIGSVYNGEQMHPYLGDGLDPEHKHDPNLTGFKTNTTKGGEGYNEIRFDDTDDAEQVFIKGERDFDFRNKNDCREYIAGHRHMIVGKANVDDEKCDQLEQVHRDKHLNVKRHHLEHIEGDMKLLIGKGEEDGGNQHIVLEKSRFERIEEDLHQHVKGKVNEKYDGKHSLTIGGDQHTKVSGNIAQQAGGMGEIHLKAGMKVIIEAGMQITLKGPGGFIDIGPAGISIQGVMVKINSGGAAGSGSGCSPTAPTKADEAQPTEPDEADDSVSGLKSARE